MALVLLGHRHDEAQVRVDHALLRRGVAALDALRELDLLGCGEQLMAADLVEEELQRIGSVDRLGRPDDLLALVLGAHDLDAARLELPAELLDLDVLELVLECKRLELRLVDGPALLGVLDEHRQSMTFKQRVQRNPLLPASTFNGRALQSIPQRSQDSVSPALILCQAWSRRTGVYSSLRNCSRAAQRGSPCSSSCSCGSTFRSFPHTGQSPAQSGAWRI